jgi:hypothetical protein
MSVPDPDESVNSQQTNPHAAPPSGTQSLALLHPAGAGPGAGNLQILCEYSTGGEFQLAAGTLDTFLSLLARPPKPSSLVGRFTDPSGMRSALVLRLPASRSAFQVDLDIGPWLRLAWRVPDGGWVVALPQIPSITEDEYLRLGALFAASLGAELVVDGTVPWPAAHVAYEYVRNVGLHLLVLPQWAARFELDIPSKLPLNVVATINAHPDLAELVRGRGRKAAALPADELDLAILEELSQKGCMDRASLIATVLHRDPLRSVELADAVRMVDRIQRERATDNGFGTDFHVDRVVVYDSRPPLYELHVDGVRITLTAEELSNGSRLSIELMKNIGRIPNIPKQKRYKRLSRDR